MKNRWRDQEAVDANLQRVLPRMAGEWFAAGSEALQPGRTWDQMHQFRLLTKRFRYTLEIFQPLYGPGLEARIKLLRRLQTYLGDINDCITAQHLLGDGEETLDGALAVRAEAKKGDLHRFWQQKFAGEGQMEGWKRYLARYAGSSRRFRAQP